MEFELFNGDYHDVDRWLADGSVDLAFVALPAEADSRCVPLYRDELVAVLPKGHRLCSLPVCPAAEIAREPIISLLETSNHDVRRALDAVGAKPDIRFQHQGRLRRSLPWCGRGWASASCRPCCCGATMRAWSCGRWTRRLTAPSR